MYHVRGMTLQLLWILYVIQLSDRVYNVTFPAYDAAEGNIYHKLGMSHYIPCLIAE